MGCGVRVARIRGYIIYPRNTVKLGQGGNTMLYLLIILFVICLITMKDKDVCKDSYFTYFVGIIMMLDIIMIGYYFVR